MIHVSVWTIHIYAGLRRVGDISVILIVHAAQSQSLGTRIIPTCHLTVIQH